ncbi:guanylate-binding 7-like isoform X2 [Pelobates cultripes]|uniref:Guanylate-binding 7-like isoform X2 n=1 Tax=Pelobates cultripes TaxID=61616 RepID=A0AAD1SRL9_PELCU|nr:guanylate-binding 7-like isoform X2 [Pelobates cultripes]
MPPIPPVTQPICLIENDVGKKMRVNPEAQKVLEKISHPLVVVSIVGPYRSGKSSLINMLAGDQRGGFPVGHTVEAKTRGIWMRCVPHSDHTLILLDTEGLGDVMKGSQHNDFAILSLATLISSVMIYNEKTTINQDALEKLYKMSEQSEWILDRISREDGDFGVPTSSTPSMEDEGNQQEDFVRKSKELSRYIHENAKVKTLQGGQPMTGPLLGKLIPTYIDVVSRHHFSILVDQISHISVEHNEQIIASATKLYEDKMGSKCINTEREFQDLHDACMDEAMLYFQGRYFKDPNEERTKSEDKLKTTLMKKKDDVWKMWKDSSEKTCKDLIQRLSKSLKVKPDQQHYHAAGGHQKFTRDKIRLVSEYNKEAKKGVMAEHVLQDYLKEIEPLEDIIKQTEKKLSEKKDQKYKVDNMTDTSQLSRYISNYRLEIRKYDRILIQMMGFVGHGKSSFVNSCLYAMSSKGFQDLAGEGRTNEAETMIRKAYPLTETIVLVDNPGFTKLDSSEICAQLSNCAGLSKDVVWGVNEGLKPMTERKDYKPDIIVPVLIHSAKYSLNDQECTSMKDCITSSHKVSVGSSVTVTLQENTIQEFFRTSVPSKEGNLANTSSPPLIFQELLRNDNPPPLANFKRDSKDNTIPSVREGKQ